MKHYRFDISYKGRQIDCINISAKDDSDAYDKAAQKVTDDTKIELAEAPVEREKK